MMCITNHDNCGALGFKFYDYDNNGYIGTVDIMNFIKHLDQKKILKIQAKYNLIWGNKQELQKAKKLGLDLDQVQRDLPHVEYNEELQPDALSATASPRKKAELKRRNAKRFGSTLSVMVRE